MLRLWLLNLLGLAHLAVPPVPPAAGAAPAAPAGAPPAGGPPAAPPGGGAPPAPPAGGPPAPPVGPPFVAAPAAPGGAPAPVPAPVPALPAGAAGLLGAAWNVYVQAVQLLWQPLLAAAVRISRHPVLWGIGTLLLVAITFGLKTYGVHWVEQIVAGGGTDVTAPRVLIALAGIIELPVTAFAALVGGIVLYWVVFAIGIIQVPLGELMEVLRELGQLLRVQDPVQRHGEGNIRAVNTRRLLEWGFVLLLVPGFSLMSTVWLAIAPVWKVYALLLLITSVGLTYGIIAQARGRKVGAGIDLILGMNGMLFLLGVQGILLSLFLPRWTEALFGGARGTALVVPSAAGIDGLLGNVWVRLFQGWIAWWPPGAGDVVGLVIGGALLAGLLALNVFAVRVLVRMLTRPPERETNGVAAPAVPAGVTVSGTAGRGDDGRRGDGSYWIPILLVACSAVTVTFLLSLMSRVWPTNELLCQLGMFGVPTVVAAWIGFGLLYGFKRAFPRLGNVAGWIATVAVCIGLLVIVPMNWWVGGAMCRAQIAELERNAESPRSDPPPRHAEPPPPPRRSGPDAPRRSDDDGIAAFFAANGAQCPDAARRRGWESLRDAQASCRSESWLARNADWR